MSAKNQIAAEFIVIMAVALFIFIILFQIYSLRAQDVRIIKEETQAEQILQRISWTTNSIALSSINTQTNITIPIKINGKHNYSITKYDTILLIGWDDKFYTYPIIANITLPEAFNKSTYTITKEKNGVTIK